MKTSYSSLKTTLGAALLAMLGTANLTSLPTAALGSASLGSTALTVAVQAAPWLGLGAGLMASGDAMASNKQIPGIGIRIRKNPGSNTRTAPVQSGPDGSFNLTGLEPGDYEVTPDGGKSMMFKVGADGKLSGVVQEDGGVRSVVKPKLGATNTDYSYKPQKADGSPADVKVKAPGTTGAATESTHAKHKDEIAAQGANARSGSSTVNAAPSSTDKGIKDQGTKSCDSCGLTGGKVAAPTPGAAEPKPAAQ